ncbi:hypothetical protein [Candidatus Protochlamydia phocaeensis]|uniref:hypothetical protein n=1 Tax=Candidatus Protochlamydia phocaeensis TaxID=1414722 RepID=UPI0008397F89|nr:hypothetical protein [Candidatus Protochlamydia phocaeensis]
MTIYISGISNQIAHIITHTENLGKNWLNRAVAFIQPIPTFISNHPGATGILVVSQLVALVATEKLFSLIENALKNQENIDLKQRVLTDRIVHLLFTGGLMAGINVSLNFILKLNLSVYALTAITTINIAASILYREIKRAQLARQAHAMQFQLTSAGNPATPINGKSLEELQQASLLPSFSPRSTNSNQQAAEKGTTEEEASEQNPSAKEERPFIPPLDLSSISGIKPSPLSSKTPKKTPLSSSHSNSLKPNSPIIKRNAETESPSPHHSPKPIDSNINQSPSPSESPSPEKRMPNSSPVPVHKEEPEGETGKNALKTPSPVPTPREASPSTPDASGSKESHQVGEKEQPVEEEGLPVTPKRDEEATQTPGIDQPVPSSTDNIWSPRSDNFTVSSEWDIDREVEEEAESLATDDTGEQHDISDTEEVADKSDSTPPIDIAQNQPASQINSISSSPTNGDNPMGDSFISFDDIWQNFLDPASPKEASDKKNL